MICEYDLILNYDLLSYKNYDGEQCTIRFLEASFTTYLLRYQGNTGLMCA